MGALSLPRQGVHLSKGAFFMTAVSAVLQGILQGLTEFLPVSSSGHLSLYQYFTGISSEESAVFSVMLHMGTLLAVIIAFRSTIWELLREFFGLFADLFRGKLFREKAAPARRMLYLLIVSCVPMLLILPLQDVVAGISADNDILVEGICFLITAALLFWADRNTRGRKDAASMKGKDALFVGCAQLIATLPGISRSGSTIAAGMVRGMEKSYAVSYSFILGLPAVLAAGLLDLKDAGAMEIGWGTALLGMAAAAIFGLLAIRLVKWLIRSDKFRIFAVYTLILGSITVVLGVIEKISGHAIQTLITGLIK